MTTTTTNKIRHNREALLLKLSGLLDAPIAIPAQESAGAINRPSRLVTSMSAVVSAVWYANPKQNKAIAGRTLYSALVPGGIVGRELSALTADAWAETITPFGFCKPILSALRDAGQLLPIQGVTASKSDTNLLIEPRQGASGGDSLPWFNCLAGVAGDALAVPQQSAEADAVGRRVMHYLRGALIAIAQEHKSDDYPASARSAFAWLCQAVSPTLPPTATVPTGLVIATDGFTHELADALTEVVTRMVRLSGHNCLHLPSLSIANPDLPQLTRSALVISRANDDTGAIHNGGRFDGNAWRPTPQVLTLTNKDDAPGAGGDGWTLLVAHDNASINDGQNLLGFLQAMLGGRRGGSDFNPGSLGDAIGWLRQHQSIDAIHEALPAIDGCY